MKITTPVFEISCQAAAMMERAENALYHGSKYDMEFLNDIYRIKQAS